MKIPSVIQKKPIEFISSLMMIISGVYFAGSGSPGSTSVIIGNLLSAFGGALISWSTVSLTSKEAAAVILQPQLSAIARQLVTVSGQISKTVNDVRTGELAESVALEMVSQAVRIMYASVNEIHVVLGQRVDSQELLDTAQRVEELATKLASNSPVAQDTVESEFMNAVAALRTQVQAIAPTTPDHNGNQRRSLIPKAAPHELESVNVSCPSCGSNASVAIGPAFGSSAMPICNQCSSKFHAHRAQDGKVITKLPGTKTNLTTSTSAGI